MAQVERRHRRGHGRHDGLNWLRAQPVSGDVPLLGAAKPANLRGAVVEHDTRVLADAETRVVYAQTPGERAALTELLDLTSTEAQLVTQLPPHRALWQIGRHRAVVDHLLSGLERERLVDTDQNMRAVTEQHLLATRSPRTATTGSEDSPEPTQQTAADLTVSVQPLFPSSASRLGSVS